ncbi:hypothetical protein FACS1894103_6450 [Campylobacterota bacterium]|nr:hypothetical protein FACS1894103_6450 [Campylobacterota bacterium]
MPSEDEWDDELPAPLDDEDAVGGDADDLDDLDELGDLDSYGEPIAPGGGYDDGDYKYDEDQEEDFYE